MKEELVLVAIDQMDKGKGANLSQIRRSGASDPREADVRSNKEAVDLYRIALRDLERKGFIARTHDRSGVVATRIPLATWIVTPAGRDAIG